MSELKPFARFSVDKDLIRVESGIEGAADMAQRLSVTTMRLHEEALHEALRQAGYALVPVEPTDAMLRAAKKVNNDNCGYDMSAFQMLDVYKAMLNAAGGE